MSRRLTNGQIWERDHGRPFPQKDATNRTLCRMLGSAHEEGAHIVLDLSPDTIEAIFLELAAEAPCGVCHDNPCSYGRTAA